MCHLILALPFIALPMLWLLPLSIGVPLYGVVLALAVAVYVMAFRTMRRPVTTGTQALMHAVGTVRSVDPRLAQVWVASESWSATCADTDRQRLDHAGSLPARPRESRAPPPRRDLCVSNRDPRRTAPGS